MTWHTYNPGCQNAIRYLLDSMYISPIMLCAMNKAREEEGIQTAVVLFLRMRVSALTPLSLRNGNFGNGEVMCIPQNKALERRRRRARGWLPWSCNARTLNRALRIRLLMSANAGGCVMCYMLTPVHRFIDRYFTEESSCRLV